MEIVTVLLGIAVLALVIVGIIRSRTEPSWAYLRNRTPDPDLWRRHYPVVEQTTVITVLGLIRDEFHLRRDDIYRLRPDDRLMAIYRAAYPRGGADAMEFRNVSTRMRHLCSS